MKANRIYVYNGAGASTDSLRHTNYSLQQLLAPNYEVETISPQEVRAGTWMNDAALFVLPGGSDLPYVRALTPDGNEKIRDFVVNRGGSFFGICAGSYYAGNEVIFDHRGQLEVKGKRDLAFFPGSVKGPVLAPYDYHSFSGASAARLHWNPEPTIDLVTFYNGGGYFVGAHGLADVKVLAEYREPAATKAAIIKIQRGAGRVLLSAVHIEYSPHLLDMNDTYQSKIAVELNTADSTRIRVLTQILEQLALTVRKQL